ncbi:MULTISPECIES: PaaI family thioesterase [Pseudonocardia]|uniref:Thioesterase domain-containing protein n=2 Tax=Pseudonocardia TaxID=1847 RepID=A0A1Y2MNM7_PSEAH|nr:MULTISPECIES: PaaI family thioesterase [Pseudonocardia]OSY36731.1 hypothetical protein BG845_05167 [Pseudonocardia autotrophica]TDN77154.1 uncharacterized protein (TIGR00369 family) [Pseudonocardia autotrophica]BBG01159.1 hypothetical protein Pdca_23680 [Pseudonocardia autotrophica]GEC26785.1 hypothetical protein PSA01_38140 [Pseudonocardia saturnea]
MSETVHDLPVIDYLRKQIAGELSPADRTHMRYPTAISQLLGFRIVEIAPGRAVVEFDADASVHGNQQGTVHGGMLVELADAAIGTARSTLAGPAESFTSIDLRATFLRPVWDERLRATAYATHAGRTVSHYLCEITRGDGKPVATVASAVMTLRGDKAEGR